ncbi:MAG: MBL fold metallo-hydrolase [Thermodesulfobacteriota bacterium]|nr:MBL fold metallo-hydrolase [Thermodesulfobacteriota bacterium]
MSFEKKLQEREAIIWYLGHSGWAIQTRRHLLIFDYVEMGIKPAEPALTKGYINSSEIRDENVFVFITHEHPDHYSRTILNWEKSVNNITYIFGWQEGAGTNHVYIEPGKRKKIGDMEVFAITSTDAGVGFLVKTDGLVIFHGGDHADWGGSTEAFKKEIDYLAKIEREWDIVFLAVTSGLGQRRESITRGVFYAIEKFLPKVMFPMHTGGKEDIYKEFAGEAEKIKTEIHYAQKKGDSFLYQNERIKCQYE